LIPTFRFGWPCEFHAKVVVGLEYKCSHIID
jgi:hypothetical protein